MRTLAAYLFIATLVPITGIVFGDWIVGSYDALALENGHRPWSEICILSDIPDRSSDYSGCQEYLAGQGIYYLGIGVIAITALYTSALLWAGWRTDGDPFLLARHFRWSAGVFLTSWSLMSILRTLIVVGIGFQLLRLMEAYPPSWLPTEPIFAAMMFTPFLVVLIPAVSQVMAPYDYWRQPNHVWGIGVAVERAQAPELYQFVDDVARRVGIAAPAWLALTVDTDFTVTNAPKRMPDLDEPLTGGVMSLSAPMMRLLTAEQIAGIVAHELGHLADPVSQSMADWGGQYGAVLKEIDEAGFWNLSTRWHLGFVLLVFRRAITETMYRSEANADAATKRVARPEAATQVLLKSALVQEAIADHLEKNAERLTDEIAADNLSNEIVDAGRNALSNIDGSSLVGRIREDYQGSPFQPSMEDRIEGFDIGLEQAVQDLLHNTDAPSPAHFGDLAGLEERATRNVHRYQLVHMGCYGPLGESEVNSMKEFLVRPMR